MTVDDHEPTDDLRVLGAFDPTTVDAPPTPGSIRHHQILERIMTTTEQSIKPSGADPERQPRRGRRWLAVAAAAAVVVAIVGVVVLVQPDRKLAPAAALSAAADNTGDVTTLRVHADYVYADERGRTLDGQVDGADYAFRIVAADGDGDAETESTTSIGSTVWESGEPMRTDVPPEERNAPYQTSSEAVVKAALTGSQVTDLGEEEVRGAVADHYRIGLTPRSIEAISALTPSQVAQFELEYPQDVTAIDVWVDDDLIRRIDVRSTTQGRSTIEFYDFGADITIRPPT